MVKLVDPEGGSAEAESRNIVIFSERIALAIRECVQAGAIHPASIVGVLAYHSTAVSTSFQGAFMPAQMPGIIKAPHGFNPKGPQ